MAANETIPLLNSAPRASAAPAKPRQVRAPDPAWKRHALFSGTAVSVEEPVVSNLFPVAETPRCIFSAESQLQTEKEIVEVCGGAEPLPFLLKDSTIYTLLPLAGDSVFARALKARSVPIQEPFTTWLSDTDRSKWAIEILDRSLRRHAWKRGLRYDEDHSLFYFSRSKPKKLWWETAGKIALREVTAPLMKSYQIEDGREVEFQRGWKHEAIRAGFVQTGGQLFLQLDPAWFLTELDGKTPATQQPVAPLDSIRADRNGANISRALRFWSAIFAKSHRELRIETCAGPLRVRLTPPSSSAPRIIAKDRLSLEDFATANLAEDERIPELDPLEV